MPQFDFFSFFVQVFWLTVGAITFYLVYLKYILKNNSQVTKLTSKIKSYIQEKKTEEKLKSSALYETVLRYFIKHLKSKSKKN
jgi:hypothetical protein